MDSMRRVRLGDVALVEISGVDKKTTDGEKPVRLCNFTDVYKNWAITAPMYDSFMVASANDKEISRFSLRRGQVAITKDSETRDDIGIPTYIADNFDDVLLGYHCALITPDETKLDGKYLNAFLHTEFIQKFFSANASGSGQRYTLSVDTLNEIPIYLPSLEEQKRIGEVFSNIDRKIEINRQINDYLEASNRTLFEYWFTQFDFPDKYIGAPYKSSGRKMIWNEQLKKFIPLGWQVLKLKEFVNIFTGKKDVSKVFPGPYTFFSCAPDPITSDEYIYDGKVILVSGNGSYTGRVSYFEGKVDLYQRTYACVPKNGFDQLMPFLFQYMKYIFEPLNTGGKHGSAIPYIVLSDLSDFPIVYNQDFVYKYIRLTGDAFTTVSLNSVENRSLEILKKSILPLLMNGQVTLVL